MNLSRYTTFAFLIPALLLGACGQTQVPTTSVGTPAPISEIATTTGSMTQPPAGETPQPEEDVEETPVAVLRLPANVELPRTVTYSNLEWTITDAWIDNVKLSLFGDSDETTDAYRVAHITLALKNPLSRYTDVETDVLRFQLGDGELMETDEAHMLNLPEGEATTTSNLAFRIPNDADWTDAKLVLNERGHEPAVLPMDGPTVDSQYPANVSMSGEVHDETSTYTVLGGTLDLDYRGSRSKLGERFLKLQMRVKYDGTSRMAVSDENFRLVIDGQPVAPADSMQEVVRPNSIQEGEVVFVIPANTQDVELKLGEEGMLSIPLVITSS